MVVFLYKTIHYDKKVKIVIKAKRKCSKQSVKERGREKERTSTRVL